MATSESNQLPGVDRTPVFATTHWTVIYAAAETQSPDSGKALDALCVSYWYPLYVYVRRKGYGAEEAKDLTQEFFAQLLSRKLYQVADPTRGKFRWFLLTSLQNFLAKEYRKATAQKRGGNSTTISLDFESAEGRYQHEPSHNATPEKLFEREWAHTLLQRVLERLRNEFSGSEKADRFQVMCAHLVEPEQNTSYADMARELGMSEGSVKVAMHRLRKRYRELYREEIASVVSSDDDIDEEIRHHVSALSN